MSQTRSPKQKESDRARAKERYARDPEKFKARVNASRLANIEVAKERDRERYLRKKVEMTDEGRLAQQKLHQSYRDKSDAKDPSRPGARWKRWADKNRDKLSANADRWRNANPDRMLDRYYTRKYGISLIEYNSMLAAQEGVCAICKKPEHIKTGPKPKPGEPDRQSAKLSVDHCHVTGQVRGLLNRSCNMMIALANEDPDVLRAAANYIERFRK